MLRSVRIKSSDSMNDVHAASARCSTQLFRYPSLICERTMSNNRIARNFYTSVSGIVLDRGTRLLELAVMAGLLTLSNACAERSSTEPATRVPAPSGSNVQESPVSTLSRSGKPDAAIPHITRVTARGRDRSLTIDVVDGRFLPADDQPIWTSRRPENAPDIGFIALHRDGHMSISAVSPKARRAILQAVDAVNKARGGSLSAAPPTDLEHVSLFESGLFADIGESGDSEGPTITGGLSNVLNSPACDALIPTEACALIDQISGLIDQINAWWNTWGGYVGNASWDAAPMAGLNDLSWSLIIAILELYCGYLQPLVGGPAC
jgi:hypothetical protein